MNEHSLPSWSLASVSAQAMSVWAEALRDSNPIHLDPSATEALGFGPRTVNQGPANLAYVLNMLAAARPDADFVQVEARFLGNVFAGDDLTVQGSCSGADSLRCEAVLLRAPDKLPVLEVEVVMEEAPGGCL